MPIQIDKVIDTQKRVVISVVASNNVAPQTLIDAGGLNFALNANGRLLGAGTDRKNVYRLLLKNIKYDVNPGSTAGTGYVQLYWENTTTGAANTILMNLGGMNELRLNEGGEPIVLGQNTATYNPASTSSAKGNVGIQTINFSGNGCITMIMDFRKHPEDYDQGAAADPVAFNAPPFNR